MGMRWPRIIDQRSLKSLAVSVSRETLHLWEINLLTN